MVSAGGDIEQGKEIGRLARRGQHSRRAALQRGDLGRHKIVGGVLQAGIKIARGLQVKQLAHILAGGVFERGGLNDGNLPGFAVAGGISSLDADGFNALLAHDGGSPFLPALEKVPDGRESCRYNRGGRRESRSPPYRHHNAGRGRMSRAEAFACPLPGAALLPLHASALSGGVVVHIHNRAIRRGNIHGIQQGIRLCRRVQLPKSNPPYFAGRISGIHITKLCGQQILLL